MHLHPRAVKKNLGVIYREICKCTPSTPSASQQAEQESIFRTFCAGRGRDLEVYLVDIDGLLRATTKKRSSTFLRKKVHPRQNPGYDYALFHLLVASSFQFSSAIHYGKIPTRHLEQGRYIIRYKIMG